MTEINHGIEAYEHLLSTASYNIVSLVGYLVGVKRDQFERSSLSIGIFESLEKKDDAKTIRSLCLLRNALMKYADRIITLMYDMKSLDNMPDYIDPEIFTYLNTQGIQVIRANQKPVQYVVQLNQMIADRINKCQPLFPLWLHWQYVRKLFIMPRGGKVDNVNKTISTFMSNLNQYPFHCYIDIPLQDNGNVLFHDAKFLRLIYEINHDEFTAYDKVKDASLVSRNNLYDFVQRHSKVVLVVDCENSDPYHLTAVLRNIQNYCPEDIEHIQKIILFDDPHTVDAWKILADFVSIPIEHEMIDRVSDRKSLVDIRMTAGTCREHYQNGINAFLLVSSDSDYWGLISALPNASFLILLEHNKTGEALLETLDNATINYCFIDDFSGNLGDIKVAALKREMKNYLDELVHFNVNDMLEEVFTRTHLQMTPGERQVFFEKYVKTLKLKIAVDGTVSVQSA